MPNGRCCFLLAALAFCAVVASQAQSAAHRLPPMAPASLGLPGTACRAAHGPHAVKAPLRGQPLAATPSPQPEATDSVLLLLSKTWDAGTGTWLLGLNWSGGTSPYTVSYSPDPSFQRNDETLAANSRDSAMTVSAKANAVLECFSATDSNGVSPSQQGLGYDPYPQMPQPTIEQDGLWWGDSLTLDGNYFDLIASENYLGMTARQVKATVVTDGGNGYASKVTFTIPDDGRGADAFVNTHGRCPYSVPFIHLYPKGISNYSNIRNVIFAPSTGHVWVAADGKVDEIDLFEHNPVIVHSITAYTKPYISQCTTGGSILVVDGVSGVGEIDQINVTSGAVTLYAHTTDTTNTPNFTRAILPVGIAADPDGSAAYVADAISGGGASRPVRFPANNASAITDNYGNFAYWSFPDPCGMDVGLGHRLFLGSADLWIGYVTAPGGYPQNTTTYLDYYTSVAPSLIFEDRDVSTASYDRFWYSNLPWAMAYNENGIEGNPARYLGADVFGYNGKIDVEPLSEYGVSANAPTPVTLNNSGQTYPYSTAAEVADRLILFTIYGWYNVPLHLRLIDPPDMAAYAPAGGWPATGGPAVPPYEANDNNVWSDSSNTDWGLSATYPGTLNKCTEIDVTPGSSNTATFYLKLPARYAGDNWQVEVRKKTPGNVLVANEVPSLSPLFTGWKRIYVERDKMFRRGGLLYYNANVGDTSIVLYKNADDTRWDNLNPGDKIAIFDTETAYEGPHDEAYVGSITEIGSTTPHQMLVTLVTTSGGSTAYTLHCAYTASPVDTTTNWPTFNPATPPASTCASAGVICSTVPDPITGQTISDTDSNQINGTGSAFYDSDMRDIKQPFDDAFVQFIAPRGGMSAVPYIDENVPFYDPGTDNGPEQANRLAFERLWSVYALNNPTPNYTYLLGCKGRSYTGTTLTAGITSSSNNHYSYIYINTVDTYGRAQVPPYTQQQTVMAFQYDTDHEFGHQFNTNNCTTPPCSGATPHHDNRSWWNCDTTGCPASNPCLEEYSLPNPPTGTNKLCKDDLLLGDQNCSGTPRPGAVRTYSDPLP